MKAGLALALCFVSFSSRVSSSAAPLMCFFPAKDQVQVWGEEEEVERRSNEAEQT